MVAGWSQVAIACLVAGTIVPGLSQAARVPALTGFLLVSSLALDSAWSGLVSRPARRTFFGLTFGLLAAWLIILLYGEALWLVLFPYYRSIGVVVLLLSIPALVLGWLSLESSNTRRSVIALASSGSRPQGGTLGVLCSGMELPPWPGTVGTSGRPVAIAQVDALHLPRLASRLCIRDRPSGPPATDGAPPCL